MVSGSCKGVPAEGSVREAASGGKKLRKLFSKEQQALYAEHAPEGVALDDLSVLGPLFCLKLKAAPEGFDRRLVTEMWFYPDGSRILELSTKCEPSEAFQVAAETRAFLGSKGIDLGGEQQMKTRTALEYFAKSFKKGPRRRRPARSVPRATAGKDAAKDGEEAGRELRTHRTRAHVGEILGAQPERRSTWTTPCRSSATGSTCRR